MPIDKVNLIACMILMFSRHCLWIKIANISIEAFAIMQIIMEAFAYAWGYNLKHNCVFRLSLLCWTKLL